MPRVPEYNQRQIALAPANTPYQTMKPTAEAFGSDVGRAMTDLGKSLGSVADSLGDAAKYLRQQDQEKNETAAVDLFNQYTAAQDKIADSYQTLPGKLAVDGYTATEKQLSVLKRDYLSRAANPEQAELLSRAIEAGSATALGQMQRYRDQQQGVYEDEVSTTRIGQLLDNVGRLYNDDREYAKGVYLAQVESLDQLRRHNAEPEEIKARLTQVASTGMRRRIEGAMAQSDLGLARQLFDGYADSLLPADREATAARLGHLEFNSRVEGETARILQASPLRLGGEQHGKTATEPNPPDAEARLALAEKIADPKLRLAVSDRIAAQNIRDRQTYLSQQRQLKGQAKDIIDRGGSFTDIPYQMLIGIDAKGKAALSAYAKAGGRIATDPVTFYRLRDEALDNPQGFLDTDLNDYIHLVHGKDMSKLTALQDTLHDKGPDDPAFSLQRVKGRSADVMLGMLGLPARLTGTAADAAGPYSQSASFKRYIDQCASAEEAAIGRDLTPDEHQKLLVKKTVEAGVVHLASESLPGSGKGEAVANDNAVPAKDDTADDARRADGRSGDDEDTDSGDGEYDAEVTIGKIGTDPNEDNVSLNGDMDAARNGVQPDQPAQPKAGADPRTEPKPAASSNKPAIAIGGSTAVLPASAAIGDGVAGWSAAAGNLVRGLAAGGEALGTGALGAGAVSALAAVGTFLVALLWPTSTAGPDKDMIPTQPMPPNLDDMRQPQPVLPPNLNDPRKYPPGPEPDFSSELNPQPNPAPQLDDQIEYFPDSPTNVEEFQQPLESTTSRRNRRREAEAEARARGETLPKKEPKTPLDGLLPESQRAPKDRRGNIPFSKPDSSLKPGDWIDISKFTQKRSTSLPTFVDPETGYYIERDHGKHSDKFWKLRSPQGKRLKSITRYGKVLSN